MKHCRETIHKHEPRLPRFEFSPGEFEGAIRGFKIALRLPLASSRVLARKVTGHVRPMIQEIYPVK